MAIKLVIDDYKFKAWSLLHYTYISINKCEEELFDKKGLTAQQFAVLMAIKYIQEPVTQTDVANWLDRNTNSITLIIDRMARDGLVKRERDLKDRRAVRLVITPKGQELLEQTRTPAAELYKDMLSCLSEKELVTFTETLEKIIDKSFQYRKITDKVREVKPDFSITT